MNLQKILRSISIVAIFLIPIFPLIVANSYFFPFITGKAFYFRILVELAFASWLILAFLDAKYRPKFTALTIGVSLFALIALIADLLGMNPIRSIVSNFERMEGWLVVVHLWMFYMATTHLFGFGEEGKRMWHRWFNFSLVIAFVISIYGILQLTGNATVHQGSTRIDASLGNAAYMAVYMLMHIGIAVYMSFVARVRQIINSGFLQWVYPILAVLFGFIIFETQTRGTALGLIGGIMLSLALYAIFGRGELKKSRWISGSVIVVIILIGVIFWMNRTSTFIKDNEVLNRLATISWNDTKTQARGYIWPMAISGALERPIFGWGQENFNYIFNANYEPKMWAQEQWFDRAHSVFLDWLVASGFVGLIAYLALYVLALIAIWRRSQLSIAQKSVLTGLIAGYAIHNIFVFDNLASYVFFFAILGFVGSSSISNRKSITSVKNGGQILSQKSPSKISVWLENKTFSTDAVEYIVAPIVLVALVGSLYFLNVRPIQANTGLIKALTACNDSKNLGADVALFDKIFSINSYMANQETREQVLACAGNVISGQYPGPTKQAFFDLANKVIEAQIAIAPKDARMYVLGGSFMNSVGQFAQSEPLLVKAHELTPAKQSVAFQLATVYINVGKKDEAVALLKQAYESDQTFGEAKSAYIIGLIFNDKEAEAKKLFGDDPTLFETERIAQAYVSIKEYPKAIVIYQKLVAADKTNIQLRAKLAQTQYASGQSWAAIETLRALEKDNPELKTQIESAIKDIQAGKK